MTTSRNRTLAALLPSSRVAEFIIQTEHIVTQMTGNAYFPSPSPTLATISTKVSALRSAEGAVQTRAPGTVPQRDKALADLLATLHLLRAYVQQIADANEARATSIIISAGFAVKKPTSRRKSAFVVVQGTMSGMAELIVRALEKRAAYHWQYSRDQKTWTDMPSTLGAKTSVKGLLPGTLYYFRFAVLTKNGEGDWSDPVSLIVK